ncbi:ABC transporter substrate-binding protein [Kineococcus sp. SYSU DK002]|uniref:ABC transporter substrate-binding protein n=1 Tax=Kineococcus sp. SYSU DK002 TaxID=3383123 RepID=UPI003D7EBDAD
MIVVSRRALAPLGGVAALALAGCGASEAVEPESTATVGEGGTQYPVVLDNGGHEVRVEAPPQRVVSLDQNSTEILLSLGLADRIVGTASWTDPVLESVAQANASVPRLADNAPSYEVLMGADPDFVTASFGRHYEEQGGVATRERLAETGVGTYLSPTDLDDGTNVNGGSFRRTTPLTIDALHTEIRELARIFDVTQRGEDLIAELTRRATAAVEGVDLSGRTVMFWFAALDAPYVAGGRGAAALLARTVGAESAFPDEDEDWPALTWEAVVAADPDVLVLGDLHRDRFPGDRLADKQGFLRTDPVAGTLTAARAERWIPLRGAEMNPSIRYVDGLEKVRAWWLEHGRDL